MTGFNLIFRLGCCGLLGFVACAQAAGDSPPSEDEPFDQRIKGNTWSVIARPVIFLNLNIREDNQNLQLMGYGISLQRIYQRLFVRFGYYQFDRAALENNLPSGLTGGESPTNNILLRGGYLEVGDQKLLNSFFVDYALGLEVNRFSYSDRRDNHQSALRVSAHTGYQTENYGIGVGLFSSLSQTTLTWGAGLDLFLLY